MIWAVMRGASKWEPPPRIKSRANLGYPSIFAVSHASGGRKTAKPPKCPCKMPGRSARTALFGSLRPALPLAVDRRHIDAKACRCLCHIAAAELDRPLDRPALELGERHDRVLPPESRCLCPWRVGCRRHRRSRALAVGRTLGIEIGRQHRGGHQIAVMDDDDLADHVLHLPDV